MTEQKLYGNSTPAPLTDIQEYNRWLRSLTIGVWVLIALGLIAFVILLAKYESITYMLNKWTHTMGVC